MPTYTPGPFAPTDTPRPLTPFGPTPWPTPDLGDSQSAQLLWNYEAELAGVSSPVVVDGVVYVGTENRMNAFDAISGQMRWRYQSEGLFLWGAPVVSDGIVYFGPFGRHVYAVDAQNGTLLWRYASEYDVSFLTLADGVVYVLTESGPLRALDAGSGALLWSYEADDATGIALEDGVAYVVTRENLLALGAATGELLSRYESDVEMYSPTLVNGTLYVNTVEGAVSAIDSATGDTIWSYGTNGVLGISPVASVGLDISPVVTGGVVYSVTGDGYLYSLNADSGKLVRRYQIGGELVVLPTVVDGVVYLGSFDSYLYALDTDTGELLWHYRTGDAIFASPAVADGVVYIASTDSTIYALKAP